MVFFGHFCIFINIYDLTNLKKIYIIGTNPLDISDCTLYALKKIKDSNLLIIPKKFKKTL